MRESGEVDGNNDKKNTMLKTRVKLTICLVVSFIYSVLELRLQRSVQCVSRKGRLQSRKSIGPPSIAITYFPERRSVPSLVGELPFRKHSGKQRNDIKTTDMSLSLEEYLTLDKFAFFT